MTGRRYGQPYPGTTGRPPPYPCPVRLGSRMAGAVLLLLLWAAPPALGQARGTLDYTRVLDLSRGVYIEGSISYLRVRDPNGALVLQRQSRPGIRFRVRERLPAGRYRVTSFERVQGRATALARPPCRCSRRIEILARGRTGVRTTVRPSRGCRMSVRARPARFPAGSGGGGAPLPARQDRHRVVGADRFPRTPAGLRRDAYTCPRAWSRPCCSWPTCERSATGCPRGSSRPASAR